jgi:hypothetical protein
MSPNWKKRSSPERQLLNRVLADFSPDIRRTVDKIAQQDLVPMIEKNVVVLGRIRILLQVDELNRRLMDYIRS